MKFKRPINFEAKILLKLNEIIHSNTPLYEYHMNHIQLTKEYLILINKKSNTKLDNQKLEYISLAHDLFKERSLDENKVSIQWKGHSIPQDTNRYVRMNLEILEEYGLDEFFNTDVQLHPLAAGIFLHKEFGIRDKEILYPIMFHSCPIISVYEKLSPKIQLMIDYMVLCDKLSSNYLKINEREINVYVDLDQIVFGPTGREFNYTTGLFLARLIAQGKSPGEQAILSTKYYHKRLCDINPLMPRNYTIKKLGGSKIWPKRQGMFPIINR